MCIAGRLLCQLPYTPKLYIYLGPSEEPMVSNPLAELSPVEVEFYRFSGMLELRKLATSPSLTMKHLYS